MLPCCNLSCPSVTTTSFGEIPLAITETLSWVNATVTGRTADGRIETVTVVPAGSPVANYGFDVTPARLITGLIT